MRYIELIRTKHYVKNLMIFLPAMLTLQLNNINILKANITGFLIFSFTASAIYIINDIKDAESDRRHPLKCKRPIASGAVPVREAYAVIVVLAVMISALWAEAGFRRTYIFWPSVYLAINLAYSMYLKHIPLLDVLALVSCYVIRLVYGAELIGAQISSWMYLTMMSASFFMGFGKRRNEFIQYGTSARKSLKGYSAGFLDKAMQTALTSSVIFYSLMCADSNTAVARAGINLLWTVPVIVVICLRYLMIIEDGKSDGDPVSVILRDKILCLLCFGYILTVGFLLYVHV